MDTNRQEKQFDFLIAHYGAKYGAKKVTVIKAPISDRYFESGAEALILNGKIRIAGCWFDFDDRWVVEEIKEKVL